MTKTGPNRRRGIRGKYIIPFRRHVRGSRTRGHGRNGEPPCARAIGVGGLPGRVPLFSWCLSICSEVAHVTVPGNRCTEGSNPRLCAETGRPGRVSHAMSQRHRRFPGSVGSDGERGQNDVQTGGADRGRPAFPSLASLLRGRTRFAAVDGNIPAQPRVPQAPAKPWGHRLAPGCADPSSRGPRAWRVYKTLRLGGPRRGLAPSPRGLPGGLVSLLELPPRARPALTFCSHCLELQAARTKLALGAVVLLGCPLPKVLASPWQGPGVPRSPQRDGHYSKDRVPGPEGARPPEGPPG